MGIVIPNGDEAISKHFTWREALFLPKWYRMGCEADGVIDETLTNLKFLFAKMDIVREFIDKPIVVHVAWRSDKYNALVKGAHNSAHMALEPNVAAVDFHVAGLSCRSAKMAFLPKLEEWEMRMEQNGDNASWVHLDTRPLALGGHRFFIP
jgi:hypothetical protein